MAKKQEYVSEEPLETDVISNYLVHGPEGLIDGNYDELIQRMMVETPTVFLKVLDKASEDEKLRVEIFNKLSKEVNQVIASNNALAQKAIDNNVENAALLRKQVEALIADGKISTDECKFCLLELRLYSERIYDQAERASQDNREILALYQAEEERIQKKAGVGQIILTGLISTAGGFGLGWLMHKLFCRNDNDD